MPVLVMLQNALPEAADRTDEQRELAMTTTEFYEQWRQRTLAEGEAASLLRMFSRRGLALTADEIARVRACTNLSMLDAWLDRAATASTSDEIFSPTVTEST